MKTVYLSNRSFFSLPHILQSYLNGKADLPFPYWIGRVVAVYGQYFGRKLNDLYRPLHHILLIILGLVHPFPYYELVLASLVAALMLVGGRSAH